MTKFARQIASAKRLIKKNGTVVTWQKVNSVAGSFPEFPDQDVPVTYQVEIVFVPSSKGNELTSAVSAEFQATMYDLYAYVGGGLAFEPAEGDLITMPNGDKMTVRWMNITQPDGIPVLYYLGLT